MVVVRYIDGRSLSAAPRVVRCMTGKSRSLKLLCGQGLYHCVVRLTDMYLPPTEHGADLVCVKQVIKL